MFQAHAARDIVPQRASPYFCITDADCEIKTRKTCCGDALTCANHVAVFEAPDCSNTASICGFPSVNTCQCVNSSCLALYIPPAKA